MAALNNCDSPYGKYGMVASHVTGCHCEIRHNSDQQEKEFHTVNDSGVLKQTLYTYPEAGRREMEERHISTFCKLSKTEARRSHTMDKNGKRALQSRIKSLKKLIKTDLKELKLKIKDVQQNQISQESEYKLIKSRGEKFDRDPQAVEAHGFSGRKNKERVVEDARQKRDVANQNVKNVENDYKKKKKQKKQKYKVWLEDALKIIEMEASKETKGKMIDEGRVEAMKRGLRRPWDGQGGQLYTVWLQARRGGKKEEDKDDENGFSSDGDETDDDDDEDMGEVEEEEWYSDEEDWEEEEEEEVV